MTSTTNLSGKVALVTGAGRGIGRSIALSLANAGASVVLAARSKDQIENVAEEIKGGGGNALTLVTDISQKEEPVTLVQSVADHFGRLDILVNNAGAGTFGPMEESTTEQWEEIMAVNARGPYLVCREALPHLRKPDIAFIINIGSVVSMKGYINQAMYSASKHAILGMSKALAKETQEDNIRVHVICPGGVDTQLVSRARPDLDKSILIDPDEIADIVLFLVTRRGNAVIDEIHVRRASSTPWS